MGDTVSSQTLHDGARNVVMAFQNISDGTGESAVTKVDVSALDNSPPLIAIDKIEYTTAGMGVRILWDATTDTPAWELPPGQSGCFDFREQGGLQNPQNTGYTGDIKFTTVGHDTGDSYSVKLTMHKKG